MAVMLQKLFPYIDTESMCFKVMCGVVGGALVALLTAFCATGNALFAGMVLSLVIAAFVGQIAPLFPVGIISVFMCCSLFFAVLFYGH